MTITIAWVRRVKDTSELILASDSRLRAFGPMDQAQKLYPLKRGDSALAFCGDTSVAYPFFLQAASALDGFIKTRTRASDVRDTAHSLSKVLNNLISSWDATSVDKTDQLKDTRILFAGWSWRKSEFVIGFFKFIDRKFRFIQSSENLSKPWVEKNPSLIVLGDYRAEYMATLGKLLSDRRQTYSRWTRQLIDFQYDPLEALSALLKVHGNDRSSLIGGAPQLIKIYPHSNTLPIVTRLSFDDHYLFGRKMFEWEKTEYPIADLTGLATKFFYPLSHVPPPASVNAAEGTQSLRTLIKFFTARGTP